MVILSLKTRTSLLAVEKFFLVLFVGVVILILEHAPPTNASHSVQFIVISIFSGVFWKALTKSSLTV